MVTEVRDPLSYYWQPQTMAQRAALESMVQFLLFGGAAGSLKSETMLINAIRYRENRHASSIIFRRTFPELEQLMARSQQLYKPLGAKWNEQKKWWRFPSGAMVRFGYCEREKDIHKQLGNEYDFIGFDESTGFSEMVVRYMFMRLRTKDPFLQERLRVHLATNPGGTGMSWHKHTFIGPVCTHCSIVEGSRLPFKVYHDATWLSDGKRINKSTAFIPGRLTDHSLLGVDYIKQLDMLPGWLMKAYRDGCWDVFGGAYFDCWKQLEMTLSNIQIAERVQSWWPCWVGVDYGFNKSKAVAYLFTKSPEGITYVIDEVMREHKLASEFATELRDRWADKQIAAWYLSPDAWAQRGDGHSLAQQMTDASGINFERASNDRSGGAMLCYKQLVHGEMVISDVCAKLIKTIPSRVQDEKEPDKVAKVIGDEMDDCYDAWRYGAYSYVQAGSKPTALLLLEAITSCDPTIAALQIRMAQNKLKGKDDAIPYLYGCGRHLQ